MTIMIITIGRTTTAITTVTEKIIITIIEKEAGCQRYLIRIECSRTRHQEQLDAGIHGHDKIPGRY